MKHRLALLSMIALLALLGSVGLTRTFAAASPAAQNGGRLLIKEASLTVQSDDVQAAVRAALNLAQTFDALVFSQHVYDAQEGPYRYADLTFRVAAADFEGFSRALKGLGEVLDETVSGQDYSDEGTDTNSRLANLHENQLRVRALLGQAADITETLLVHEELVGLEEQIGDAQGRINYLADRAGLATVRLSLVPLPPTPTPTPTPTATPLPTVSAWRPGDTASVAAVELQETAQATADFALYNGIVCGPWLLFFAAVGGAIWWAVRKWRGRRAPDLGAET